MKKTDLIIIIATLGYSLLFYHQLAGVNFLLFTVLLTILQLLQDPGLIKNKSWLLNLPLLLASGAAVLINGNTLAVIANVSALIISASLTVHPSGSIILSFFHHVFSWICFPLTLVQNTISRFIQSPGKSNAPVQMKLLVSVVPIIVFFIFFLIYRGSNPIFRSYTDLINFNFISFGWILFTIGGLLIVFVFFNQKIITILNSIDQSLLDKITGNGIPAEDAHIRLYHEWKSGVILLTLLNVMLLFINLLDVNFIWGTHVLPEGVTYSEYVHQGIYSLIFSILLAIALIIIYFRGDLNFYKNNVVLKFLAILWIIQNVILVIITAAKNDFYILEYHLTYKRIGVYVYLLMCLIGLVFTIIKIVNTKSLWFLLRKNFTACYLTLIVAAFVNWDGTITEYNLSREKPDLEYLSKLSQSSYPSILLYLNSHPEKNINDLKWKVAAWSHLFYDEYQSAGWQSWNLRDQQLKEELDNAYKMKLDL